MVTALEYIGRKTIRATDVLRDLFAFAGQVLSRMFNPASYNSATRAVIASQIYFTAVQILPLFAFVAILTGILGIGIGINLLKGLTFTDTLVRLIMAFLITEVAPLTTVALITLRSGAAMNTEISVMKVNKELRALELFNIDPIGYLYMPRVLTGVITVVLLSGISVVLILTSGLLSSNLFFGVALDFQTNLLLQAIDFSDIVLLLFKALALGFFITLIPIWFGLTASRELTSIPVAVLNGMLKVFIAIVTIEVLTLAIRFI